MYAKTSLTYRPSLYYPLKKLRKRQIGGCCCCRPPDAIPSFAATAAANRGGHNGLLPPVMSTLPPSLPTPLLRSSSPSFLRPSITNDIAVFIPSNEFRQPLTHSKPIRPLILSYCQLLLSVKVQFKLGSRSVKSEHRLLLPRVSLYRALYRD